MLFSKKKKKLESLATLQAAFQHDNIFFMYSVGPAICHSHTDPASFLLQAYKMCSVDSKHSFFFGGTTPAPLQSWGFGLGC